MSIISGFLKQKIYDTDSNNNHKLISFWTSTDTVFDENNRTLSDRLDDISSSLNGYKIKVVDSEPPADADPNTIYFVRER